MNQLMDKLESIADETGEGQANAAKKGGTSGGDEFNRMRANIGVSVREVRQQLKMRDELLGKGMSGTKQTVQMSHKIRQQIKTARETANRLHAMQRKEAAKRKNTAGKVEQQQEVVDLVFKHIEECEALEKKRFTSKATDNRIELFSSMGRGFGAGGSNQVGPVSRAPETELPDIETQEGLQQLRVKDQAIDKELEQVSAGVQDLKNIALDMRDEVQMQTAMVDEITNKVDKANVHLNNLNKRMKQTLQQTRSADRFILDIILVVILLGVVGYIISMVS